MSAKNSNSTARAELLALLERHNYSPGTFDKLRADSYEKQLAAHSLDSLDLVYSLLLMPGKPVEEHIPNCPTWPNGTKWAGQLPGKNVLFEIKRRLLIEQTLNSMGQTAKILEKLRARAAGLPDEQTAVLESVITMVGDELLQAKLTHGSPIAANLPVVDRLLTAQMARTSARQEDVKIDLRKQAEARQQKQYELDRVRFQRETVELFIKWSAEKAAREIATGNLSHADKIEQLGQAMFGEDWADPKK